MRPRILVVIQDEYAEQLVQENELARSEGVELATSTLYNAWQFYKNDNYSYDRKKVAKEVEGLITAMLRTNNLKNWFRAYLNLGLIEKILGHDRLIPCTARARLCLNRPLVGGMGLRRTVRPALGQPGTPGMEQDPPRQSGACNARKGTHLQAKLLDGVYRTRCHALALHSPATQGLVLAWLLWNKLKVSLWGERSISPPAWITAELPTSLWWTASHICSQRSRRRSAARPALSHQPSVTH